ncbi:MAG: DegT/DnrJ/EryC1/StrS family aminotransferase [Candidatus Eremiobacteraeota bacterium]|nr:DegT/DnrJ/EryC1/StrS family aminotransferase [Candidatus Eremiobacteraeota bacterium]
MPEIDAAMRGVVDTAAFVAGPAVAAFERDFAAYAGAKHCIAMGSGTDALHAALLALGVGPGDEVITQTNTFVATVEAIEYTGARCVLVDVALPTYAIDVDAVAGAITPKTKAIVPVHMFGQPADLQSLRALCDRHGIAMLEDASQAHGAEYRGARIGTRSVASWSFYPGKNLGAFGEGGAVTCEDDAFADRLRVLIDHGSRQKYVHSVVGYNYRMDGLQGAVLRVKLAHMDRWNAGRARVARRYGELLAGVERPVVPDDVVHAWHVYPVLVDERDEVRKRMESAGIGTNVHYPIPCHLQEAYRHLGYAAGSFPRAESLAQSELSLPIYPGLSDEAIEYVASTLREAVGAVA